MIQRVRWRIADRARRGKNSRVATKLNDAPALSAEKAAGTQLVQAQPIFVIFGETGRLKNQIVFRAGQLIQSFAAESGSDAVGRNEAAHERRAGMSLICHSANSSQYMPCTQSRSGVGNGSTGICTMSNSPA